MTVAAVRRLQTELARLGYFHHIVTGYYGLVTTAAVKQFQRSAGLKSDGIWGRRSETALKRRRVSSWGQPAGAPVLSGAEATAGTGVDGEEIATVALDGTRR